MSGSEFEPVEGERSQTLDIENPDLINWVLSNHLGEVGRWILAEGKAYGEVYGVSCERISINYIPFEGDFDYYCGRVISITFQLFTRYISERGKLTLELGKGNLPILRVIDTCKNMPLHFAPKPGVHTYTFNPNPIVDRDNANNEIYSLLLECFTTTSAYLRAISRAVNKK